MRHVRQPTGSALTSLAGSRVGSPTRSAPLPALIRHSIVTGLSESPERDAERREDLVLRTRLESASYTPVSMYEAELPLTIW